jgi:hypothetical protein
MFRLVGHRGDGRTAVWDRDPSDVTFLVDSFAVFIGRQIDP